MLKIQMDQPLSNATGQLPKTWWNSAFSIPKRYFGKGKGEKKKLWIVSYDISDAKRLRKAASISLNYGARKQHSVYECHLSEKRFMDLYLKLCSLLDQNKDSLIAYPIHGSHVKKVKYFGLATPPKLTKQKVF